MPSVIALDSIMFRLLSKARKIDYPPDLDLKGRVALAFAEIYGDRVEEYALQHPEYLNIMALALSMQDRLIMHRLSKGTVSLVHDTDLHMLPSESPAFLKNPFLISSRKPEQGDVLFGNTIQIGGYWMEDTLYLILLHKEGLSVVPWEPKWAEEAIDDFTPKDMTLVDREVWDGWKEEARRAVRFITVFSILYEAENTPVRIEELKEKRSQKAAASSRRGDSGSRRSSSAKWSIRRVYIDARLYKPAPESETSSRDLDKSRLEERAVMVSGHLKRQPYGPRLSLRKWIYVQSYEARRWVSPDRPVRVDVVRINES